MTERGSVDSTDEAMGGETIIASRLSLSFPSHSLTPSLTHSLSLLTLSLDDER